MSILWSCHRALRFVDSESKPGEAARQRAEEEGKDPEQAKPEPTAQRNFTDPDLRIMPRSGAFQQSYTAQVVVDAKTQLIVAQEVLQTPSDARQMEPLVEQAVANTGRVLWPGASGSPPEKGQKNVGKSG